jgi:4'-phosphopantetheinyl transferase EntD
VTTGRGTNDRRARWVVAGPAVPCVAEEIRRTIHATLPDAAAFAGGLPWVPYWPGAAGQAPDGAERRRREFEAGRFYARSALSTLGCADAALTVGEDRAPIWPSAFAGSISHCDAFCGAVVAERRSFSAVGFDVETAEPLDRPLCELIAVAEEIEEATRALSVLPDKAAKLIFSIKEAVFKAYWPATGKFLDFHDVFIGFGASLSHFEARLISDDAPDLRGHRTFYGRHGEVLGVVYSIVLISTEARVTPVPTQRAADDRR